MIERRAWALRSGSEPLLARALRFGRALIVGGGATVVDVSVLTTCIRLLGLAPTTARVPALLAGSCVQFFGNRSFTFRAQSGDMARQARAFVVCQAIVLGLNFALFQALVRHAWRSPPEILSLAGSFLVFVTFEYPVRKLVVFR